MPLRCVVFIMLLLVCGCPQDERDTAALAELQPTEQIPADDPLLTYAGLRLGMSNLEVAQAYNAPDGQGKGFKRGVEEYGDARNHIIEFQTAKGEPKRKIVLRVYQDKLARLVDRRDWLTEQQSADWLAQLKKKYGEPKAETLGGAQWVWGDRAGVSLTFTQDNSSATAMSAHVELLHAPTYDASVRYTAFREKAN